MLELQTDSNVISFYDGQFSWVSQLNNSVLQRYIKHKFMKKPLESFHIDALNNATHIRQNDRDFTQRLLAAGISLDLSKIAEINQENHQIYYRSLIKNKTLRDISASFHIKSTLFYKSTKQMIEHVNRKLCQFISENELKQLLSQIGITLTKSEVCLVLKEGRLHIEKSPLLDVYNVNKVLKKSIRKLKRLKLRRKFLGYLSLILNESALSISDGNILRASLLLEMSNSPCIKIMKMLPELVNRLERKLIVLQGERQFYLPVSLKASVKRTLINYYKPSLQQLLKQQRIIERWAQQKTVCDLLHRQISQVASNVVLCSKAAKGLFNRLKRSAL